VFAKCSATFFVATALIAGKMYDFVVLLAQGAVVRCLFALRCKHLSFEARGKNDGNANVRLKYSIFGGVVPRRAEFRQIACEINGLRKVGV
jgi:hypothetical protein